VSSFSLFTGILGRTQDIEQTLQFAKEQMAWDNVDKAIPAFRRVLFFDTSHTLSYETCKNLASCYILKMNYQKARKFSRLAYNFTTDDSVKNEIKFQLAYLYLFEKDYNYALIELLGLKNFKDEYFKKKKAFYLGITYFEKADYDKSLNKFVECLDSSDIEKKAELMAVFAKIKRFEKRYNPKITRTLSMIIPGSGQLYCGDYKEAINSVVLTTILGYLFINTAANYSFIDAFISVSPWFQRYYQGGFDNAKDAALLKKHKKIDEQYQYILTLLEPVN